MIQITYNGNIYNIHPTYDLYASNKDGHIICINRNVTPIKKSENGVIEHINDKRNNNISNLQFVSQTDIEYYKLENDVIEEILNKEGYSKFINDLIEDKFINDLIEGIVIEI